MQAGTRIMGWLMMAALAGALPARANHITVGNVGWANAGNGQSYVSFDLSWSNSWRAAWSELAEDNVSGGLLNLENWDAAWVFVKFRPGTAAYAHATLSANALDHVIPAAAGAVSMTNAVGLTAGRKANDGTTPGEGVGVFIYRAGNGHGHIGMQNVKLRWLHGADGVANAASVDLQVHAIEMVYVAEGPFALGSGGAEDGRYYQGANASVPYIVTSENPITLANTSGNLWGAGANAPYSGAVVANAFPKGYNAFYCMKYGITQGQYTGFLNAIGNAAPGRFPGATANRHTITESGGVYTAGTPYVACNYISWADGASYAAWAGLRPMTELEYEKSCRGPRKAVANEYAWGSTTIAQATGISNPGTENETASNSGANAVYGSHASVQGPLRVGAFAGASTTRAQAGASYWGIMELSGNLWERAVTTGKATGLAFMGTHGSGTLTVPADWPDATADGAGFRGGDWVELVDRIRVSNRIYAASPSAIRSGTLGWRAVRSAP